jgi:hypothetical protein
MATTFGLRPGFFLAGGGGGGGGGGGDLSTMGRLPRIRSNASPARMLADIFSPFF